MEIYHQNTIFDVAMRLINKTEYLNEKITKLLVQFRIYEIFFSLLSYIKNYYNKKLKKKLLLSDSVLCADVNELGNSMEQLEHKVPVLARGYMLGTSNELLFRISLIRRFGSSEDNNNRQ